MLYAVLALVAAIAAAFFFYQYTSSADNKVYLALCLISALATIGLGGMFLAGRMAKKEDIHITE